MIITFSWDQVSKTGHLDFNLLLPQYKLDLRASFTEIKFADPKLRQDQITKVLGCTSITLKRYGKDKNMLSPYRIPPNITQKRKQKILNTYNMHTT